MHTHLYLRIFYFLVYLLSLSLFSSLSVCVFQICLYHESRVWLCKWVGYELNGGFLKPLSTNVHYLLNLGKYQTR